jgi:prostaglandin-endoperoxide synthase 2
VPTKTRKPSEVGELLRLLFVTAIEASAVYFWLRHEHEDLWLGVVVLAAGEILETAIFRIRVAQRVRERWGALERPAADGGHFRRVQLIAELAGTAEIGIWLLWMATVHELGETIAAGVLLVLMHLKHHIEAMAIRDVPFRSRLFAVHSTVASAMEVGGAVACLALLHHGHDVLAAIALGTGLLIEHAIQIGVLRWEVRARDIRLPRDHRWQPPRFRRRVERHLFTHGARFWRLVQRIKPLAWRVNRFAINELIDAVEPRPNPLSTMAPYTSWASLTNRRYSGRHLPPVPDGATHCPATTEPPRPAAVAALFRRSGDMRECPRSTVLFGFFAQWFTDGFLRTKRNVEPGRLRDTLKNESTHEIDLCQLYGLKRKVTRQLRTGHGGLLKSQIIDGEEYPPYYCCDAEPKPEFHKLLKPVGFDKMLPRVRNQLFASGTDVPNAGVVAFNTLFLREHNRIARRLSSENPTWHDDRVFGTARNILTVVLLRIVVEEYINHITPNFFEFRLAPSRFPNERWLRPNWMAIEFNLLYRWHSLVPTTLHLNGKRLAIDRTLTSTKELTSMGLGAFMEAASSQPAGHIGLFNTPSPLVEWADLPSIRQARVAGLYSYNDYRRFCGLLPAAHFDEISSDPTIQDELFKLYGSVENVEFYVGLFAEDTQRNGVLPQLMTVMVAFDAFSQALTNPLLAPRIYNEQTFSRTGLEIIDETRSIADLVRRNVPAGSRDYFVSLSRRDDPRA